MLDFGFQKPLPTCLTFGRAEPIPISGCLRLLCLRDLMGRAKTTLLRALVDAIRFAVTPWTANQKPLASFLPFFSEECRDQPTQFCVEFETDWLAPGKTSELFRYQFSVVRDKQNITSNTVENEALFYFPKGRPRRLFERGESNESIYVSSEFGIKPTDDRLKAVRPDTSVLSRLRCSTFLWQCRLSTACNYFC